MQLLLLIIILLIIVEYINTDQECIRDDQFCINGENTVENQKCIKWSLSKTHKIIKIFENTTLCTINNSTKYWCPTDEYNVGEKRYDWDYCTPKSLSCQISNNICENMINWEIFDKSINLNISNKLNIVIILNKSHSQCAICIRCYQCDQIKEIIEIFSGCQLLNNYQNSNDLIIFNNLNQNTKYIFYILPIKHGKLEGSVFNLFLTTVYQSPQDIKIINRNKTSIKIHWTPPGGTEIFGYEIKMKHLTDKIYNTTQTNIIIDNLHSCRQYCLTIKSINIAGKSAPSENICTTTKIDSFDNVIMKSINNKSIPVLLEWYYNNTSQCSNISFLVEITNTKENKTFIEQTSNKYIWLNKLDFNIKYNVKVKPIFNDEFGQFSEIREIFVKMPQRLIFFVLYLFIIMFLLLIVSYVIYNKDLLLLKRKKATVKNAMLLTESSPVRTEIKTSLIKNGDIQLKEISNSNQKSKNSKCDLPIENNKLSKEFKEINIKAENIEILHKLTTVIGRSIENKSKNRFINILPFDQTRIILNSSPSKNDYINANYIPFLHDINKHEYIASQGPINDTINDFWQMIWENNVSLIIMLTRTYEEEKFKCLQYWPEHIDQKIEYGENKELQVRIAEEINRNSFVERKLQIFDKISNENRLIIHLHMLEWFDYSAPNLSEFESLIFRFQEIVLAREIHPYLIHCSAGVGRTGTFIVLDRIIRKLMNGNMNIDICAEILELRKYRKMMVQRAAQYIFIHEFVQYFIGKYIKNINNINQDDIYFNS